MKGFVMQNFIKNNTKINNVFEKDIKNNLKEFTLIDNKKSDIHFIITKKFIRENFNELNLVDIDQAINLSLKGDLEVDVEHYQNFTPLYISKILKAYKEYRGKVIFAIRERLNKLENYLTVLVLQVFDQKIDY